MLSEYQWFAMSQFGIYALGSLCAFLLYFGASKSPSAMQRLRTSAHGLWLLGAAGYAVLVAPASTGAVFAWLLPFWAMIVIFLASLIYGVFAFDGSRWVHLFQLVELPCAFVIWLVGSMTISHDWL